MTESIAGVYERQNDGSMRKLAAGEPIDASKVNYFVEDPLSPEELAQLEEETDWSGWTQVGWVTDD